MVGGWMMASTLSGLWLWQSKVLKNLWGVPVSLLSTALFFTFILLKSTGAYVLVAFGILIQLVVKLLKTPLPVLILLLMIPAYVGLVGINTYITPERILEPIYQINAERASSLKFRMDNEREIVIHTQKRPLFGWGGYNRNRPRAGIVVDSLWIIAYSQHGIVGLCSVFSIFLLPIFVFVVRYPAKWWLTPDVAPGAVIAVILLMYSTDCLVNNMYNPVFILASGSLAGLAIHPIAAPRSQGFSNSSRQLSPQRSSRPHPHHSTIFRGSLANRSLGSIDKPNHLTNGSKDLPTSSRSVGSGAFQSRHQRPFSVHRIQRSGSRLHTQRQLVRRGITSKQLTRLVH